MAQYSLRGDIDAWLTLTADLVITSALLQSSVGHALGVQLPWLSVLLPASLANAAAALHARRHGLTALPFGPNTVFIVVFGRAVLEPMNAQWQQAGLSDLARGEASLALLAASLSVYAVVVALGVFAMLRWRPVLPRRALVIPLAAICWTHLVGTSVQSLTQESLAVWLPAALLFGLLFFSAKGPLTWILVFGLWAGLSWMFPVTSVSSIQILDASIPASSALVGLEAFTLLASSEFWLDVFPLLAALALTNSFGVLENVAAAWEVGDRHSARTAVAMVTVGTAVGAVLGAGAPVTVYIGHPAFRARGARWLYAGLAALSLLALLVAFERGFFHWFPIAIFHGAILYIGAMVGLLPRSHLHGPRDAAKALLVATPIIAGWLAGLLGASDHLILSWLG